MVFNKKLGGFQYHLNNKDSPFNNKAKLNCNKDSALVYK